MQTIMTSGGGGFPFPGASPSNCAWALPPGLHQPQPSPHQAQRALQTCPRQVPACLAEDEGLETLAPFPLGPLMSLQHVFLEAVMKAFQEMRGTGTVKYIAAATNLWLVCFYF